MPIFNTDMIILLKLYSFLWSLYVFQSKHSWIQKKKKKKTVHNGDSEAVAKRCSVKKVFLEISQNSLRNTCARVSFLQALDWKACNFIKKRDPNTQVFSSEICEIFSKTYVEEYLRTNASIYPTLVFWNQPLTV